MIPIATVGKRLRAWLVDHRAQWGLSLRVTVAATATLAASQLLELRIPLWAVLTAVILVQLSVGRSLRATTDYFIGTLGAGIYAGAVGALFPTGSALWLYVGLALAVAPGALLAALHPRYSAASFTAVLVYLAPTLIHVSPIASALERLLEVAVGGGIGLLVSLLVLPARAHDLTISAAADMLALMARFQPGLFAQFSRRERGDESGLAQLQDRIGQELLKLETLAHDARHERLTRFSAEPDQGPLVRTMLRLRHDMVMIWRAALQPLPPPFDARLGPSLTRVGASTAEYLDACAHALLARRRPPPMDAVVAALDRYAVEMGALRSEGVTRGLSAHDLEQIFALGFALDQLRHHFTDLARCIAEVSTSGQGKIGPG